jgi:hypothetical protein
MQPYFFPYLGHFGLIANTDEWVVFDITQYTPKTYMSRNEVLKGSGGRQQIFAELSNSSIHIKTHEARLRDPDKTRMLVLGSLTHYRKKAPFYENVKGLIERTFEQLNASDDPGSLVNLNVAGLQCVCEYLNLNFNYRRASQLDVQFDQPMGAGDWAPAIASQLGASHYLNPVGGRALFNPTRFESCGVKLEFLSYEALEYVTPGFQFEPNLSVLDVLMWNSADTVRKHLARACSITPHCLSPATQCL